MNKTSYALVALVLLSVLSAAAGAQVDKAVIRGQALDEKLGLPTQFTWNATNFAGFWYDLDDGLKSESLFLNQSGLSNASRTIKDDPPGLIYTSERQLIKFEVNKNKNKTVENSLDASGSKSTAGTHYGKLGWMAEEYVAVNGKAKKLAKLLIEQEEATADKKTLAPGETWQIGGWQLTANSIDAKADPRQVWLTLSYNGQKLDDAVVESGDVYTYVEKSIAGESDVPMFTTYVDSVFSGATSDMVQLRFTWAIDRAVTEVKSGDTVGIFEVKKAEDKVLELENDASIDLSVDTTADLAGDFKFKVANDDKFLRFMPIVEKTQPGTYEIRGNVLEGNTSNPVAPYTWDATTFAGFWYDLDEGLMSENLNLKQTLTDTSRTIKDSPAGLTYTTTMQPIEFEVSENKKETVENSLDANGSKVAAGTHYGKLGWMAEEYVAVNGKAKKLAKLLIEQEEATADKKTLAPGETWQIGGWQLTPQSIDAKATPRQVWLTLSYNGQKLDDAVVESGDVYTYVEKSIAGESDVPMFTTYVDSVFSGATSDMVQLRFTWAIDRAVTEVKSGDTVGIFEVKKAEDKVLELENDASIDLSADSTATLAGEFKFKVADDDQVLRFYPMVERTVGVVITPEETPTATPTVTPTTTPGVNVTVTPETPAETIPTETTPAETTPTEPGFEAVFAIAGLLAVAYLVLRQRT